MWQNVQTIANSAFMKRASPENSTSKPESNGSPTITDIALAAGVNVATVSRALRGVPGKVSAQRREEIERIAREMGYRPNALAASLRTRQSNLAAIIVPDLGNPVFGPMVQGIERSLRAHGHLSLIVQTPSDPKERESLIVALASRQVSGLMILAAENHDPLLHAARRSNLPTVLVNRGSGDRQFAAVVNDDRESVRQVLEHLTGLGHRHIAHVAGPGTSSTGSARRVAFEQMARELNLTTSTVVESLAFTREAGRAATEQLMADGAPFTAIFAANDLLALGALDVLRAHKLAVPAQVSLVGHNDMPLVDLIDPPLTTVRIALEEMSEQAAALFIERVDSPDATPITRMLLPTLVVRESTAPPAA